jgi:hypothetical protein
MAAPQFQLRDQCRRILCKLVEIEPISRVVRSSLDPQIIADDAMGARKQSERRISGLTGKHQSVDEQDCALPSVGGAGDLVKELRTVDGKGRHGNDPSSRVVRS